MMSEAASPRDVLFAVDTLDVDSANSLASITGWRITQVIPSDDLVTRYRDGAPDAVVLDLPIFQASIAELLKVRRRPILVVGPDDPAVASQAIAMGAVGWLVGTPTVPTIAIQVDLAVRVFQQIEKLAAEKLMLAQTLETRKLVERAKAIFMRRLKLDEATAHRRLQQESQNRRIGLAELAKRIIESEEMMASAEEGVRKADTPFA